MNLAPSITSAAPVKWLLSRGSDMEALGPDELRERDAEQVLRLSGMCQ